MSRDGPAGIQPESPIVDLLRLAAREMNVVEYDRCHRHLRPHRHAGAGRRGRPSFSTPSSQDGAQPGRGRQPRDRAPGTSPPCSRACACAWIRACASSTAAPFSPPPAMRPSCTVGSSHQISIRKARSSEGRPIWPGQPAKRIHRSSRRRARLARPKWRPAAASHCPGALLDPPSPAPSAGAADRRCGRTRAGWSRPTCRRSCKCSPAKRRTRSISCLPWSAPGSPRAATSPVGGGPRTPLPRSRPPRRGTAALGHLARRRPRHRGKNAAQLLDSVCMVGIAVGVTHRSRRRLFGLAGLALLGDEVAPTYRPEPGRGRGSCGREGKPLVRPSACLTASRAS